MSRSPRICWVDGRILPLEDAAVRADDSAFAEGRGCYTTALVTDGHVRFLERHARRISRNAPRLRIGEIAEETAAKALTELAGAAFPDDRGIVRLQATRDGDGGIHLVGVARELPDDRPSWSAIVAPFPHDGGFSVRGGKVTSRLLHALALDAARDAGVEEALLFDTSDHLVEGAHTNLFVVDRDGRLRTPPSERGAVSGIARELTLERVPEATEGDIRRDDLAEARELIAVNAVRGARPVTQVDESPIGDGRPGPFATRLADVLSRD